MMMIRNECCDCATGTYPCLGETCSRRHVHYLVCDRCHSDENERLYSINGEELCEMCLEECFPNIDANECESITFDTANV